jgi:glycosyltransferase involved in cell wall biosynthesis
MVQSIFAQTLTNWELIAVDDGSTDDSWQYLQRIDDPRVHIVRNEANMGSSTAHNRGVELARGMWIAKMDADDVSVPTRLEKQVEALEANPDVDVLGTGCFVVDRTLSNVVQTFRPPTDHAAIIRYRWGHYPLLFGALMGKAEWWRRWGLDARVGPGHEFDLYFRSHLKSSFSNVSEPLYIYRRIGHTKSFGKLATIIYYETLTLLRHGFKMGLPFTTLFGLTCMIPRFLGHAIKFAVGSKISLISSQGLGVACCEDIRAMKEALAAVSKVEVPLKSEK